MGAMFFTGLLVQRKSRSCSKNRNNKNNYNSSSNIVFDGDETLEKSRNTLFTPPRVRSPPIASSSPSSSSKAVVRTSSQQQQQPLMTKKNACSGGRAEFDLEDDREEASIITRGVGAKEGNQEGGGEEGSHNGGRGSPDYYDDDEAFILGLGRLKRGRGMWERATAGTRRYVSVDRSGCSQ